MNRQQAMEEKLRILDGIIDGGEAGDEGVDEGPGLGDMWSRLRELSRPPYIPLEMYIPKMRF